MINTRIRLHLFRAPYKHLYIEVVSYYFEYIQNELFKREYEDQIKYYG